MKRLLVFLAVLPLLFSCDIDGAIDDMLKVSPTMKGFSFSKQSGTDLGDADATSALTAFIVAKSKFEGSAGQKVDCQGQVMHGNYGGEPDKLEIYYFLKGSLTYVSSSEVTIAINGKFTALNGTWELTRADNGDKITLQNGSKKVELKFWHETD